jgi:hypothetical protein
VTFDPDNINKFLQIAINNSIQQYTQVFIKRVVIATENVSCSTQDYLDILDTIIEPSDDVLIPITIEKKIYLIDSINLIYCRHRKIQLGVFDNEQNSIIWNM